MNPLLYPDSGLVPVGKHVAEFNDRLLHMNVKCDIHLISNQRNGLIIQECYPDNLK